MVVIGGITAYVTSRLDVYSVENGVVSWSHQGQNSPYGFAWPGATSRGDNIWIAGGWAYIWSEGEWSFQKVSRYTVSTNRWDTLPDLITERQYTPSMFILGNTLYATGGSGGDSR